MRSGSAFAITAEPRRPTGPAARRRRLVGVAAGRRRSRSTSGSLRIQADWRRAQLAGAPLHLLDVADEQLRRSRARGARWAEASAARRGGPRPRRHRRASGRRGRRSARKAALGPSARPASSVAAARGRSVHSSLAKSRRLAARRMASSSSARTMRWRSVGSIVSAAQGARRARTACSAAGPRASSIGRSPALAQALGLGAGARLSVGEGSPQVQAGARRPRSGRMPGRAGPGRSRRGRAARKRPTLKVASTGRKAEQSVLELRALAPWSRRR